jgi:PBP1b-binding outer membrane lipoprotein LpoB
MSKLKALILISATTLLLSGCIVRNQPQKEGQAEAPVKNNTTVKTSIVVEEKEPGVVVDPGIQN